jgi:drug/metabolite transporter (DMT)-like permease
MAITIGMIKARGISPVFGSRANFLPLLMRGAAGAASMSFYYFAIFQLTLADVMTVFYTHPAMVVALAWVCRGEAVSRPALLGMVLSLLGVVVVAQPPFLTGGTEWSAQHISGKPFVPLRVLTHATAEEWSCLS